MTETKEVEKVFSADELAFVTEMLKAGEPILSRISHNCSNSQFLDLFGVVDIKQKSELFFGTPVYKTKIVPEGEIWFQSRNGMIIRRFKI